MIEKDKVLTLVENWLDGREDFLVDLSISADNKITVEIDNKEGVWIDDCVALSRHIEEHLNREDEDFELEVGSAGIGQPFKILRQYKNNIGNDVEVLTKEGKKLCGTLKDANDNEFTVAVLTKVKEEGAKRPKLVKQNQHFNYDDIKYTKYLIAFK